MSFICVHAEGGTPTHPIKAVGRFPVYPGGQAAGEHGKGTKQRGNPLEGSRRRQPERISPLRPFRSARPIALPRAA
ncbi:hypothetical protein LI167_19885 [Phocaeicola dorei]|uniref:hypothetical protein n=1 Tax=Bacteroidaceae TaxID=815 RepID=UPI001314A1BB|nr:hypothetical protein [Bacteroides finegoldii]MCB6665594.1 hypothetical protein [Phocaeicola dorei]